MNKQQEQAQKLSDLLAEYAKHSDSYFKILSGSHGFQEVTYYPDMASILDTWHVARPKQEPLVRWCLLRINDLNPLIIKDSKDGCLKYLEDYPDYKLFKMVEDQSSQESEINHKQFIEGYNKGKKEIMDKVEKLELMLKEDGAKIYKQNNHLTYTNKYTFDYKCNSKLLGLAYD